MKRSSFMQMFLVVVLLVSFVSCGENGEPIATEDQETIEEITTIKPVEPSETTNKTQKPKEIRKNKYLFIRWKSSDKYNETKHVFMKADETIDLPLEITNISEQALTVEIYDPGHPKNSLETPDIFPNYISLKPNETKEFYFKVYCSKVDRKEVCYDSIGQCKCTDDDENIVGYICGNANIDHYKDLPDLIVERTDLPDYPIVWKTASGEVWDSKLDIYNDVILQRSPVGEGGDNYFNLIAYDTNTGEKLWSWLKEKDYMGYYFKSVSNYYIEDQKAYLYIEFPSEYDVNDYPKIEANRYYYAVDIKTGEVLDDSEKDIKNRIDRMKAEETGKKYKFVSSYSGENSILVHSLVEIETNKIMWTKEFMRIKDFVVLHDSIILIEENNSNMLDVEYYMHKYSHTGELISNREIPTNGRIAKHNEYVLLAGCIEPEFYEPHASYHINQITSNDFISIIDISRIDNETLNTIWTQPKNHDTWTFTEDDFFIVQEDNIFYTIDIRTGEKVWTLDDFSTYGNFLHSRIENGYFVVTTKNLKTLFGTYHLFINIKTSEITEIKIENFLHDSDSYQYHRKKSFDGYIIRQYFWLDPETYEILGINVGLDGETFDPILEIRDGLMYYISRGIDKKYYLVCKKIVDTKDTELEAEE